MCIACDRDQAGIVFNYIRAYFEEVPALAKLVRNIGSRQHRVEQSRRHRSALQFLSQRPRPLDPVRDLRRGRFLESRELGRARLRSRWRRHAGARPHYRLHADLDLERAQAQRLALHKVEGLLRQARRQHPRGQGHDAAIQSNVPGRGHHAAAGPGPPALRRRVFIRMARRSRQLHRPRVDRGRRRSRRAGTAAGRGRGLLRLCRSIRRRA